MEHQDKGLPAPDGPRKVWQSLHQKEERGMEMRLNTDQLCALARYRERENVWGHWLAIATLLVGGAASVYMAVTIGPSWSRLGAAWMAAVIAIALWGARAGARKFQAGESCAQFMVRELEGSRRTLLEIQWGIALLLPTVLLFWWGDDGALRASALHLDPSSWRYHVLTNPWRFPAVLFLQAAMWAAMGLEARKRTLQAKDLRRAIGEGG